MTNSRMIDTDGEPPVILIVLVFLAMFALMAAIDSKPHYKAFQMSDDAYERANPDR